MLQTFDSWMLEALPDFGLPESVKTFDCSLETNFIWRSKDWCHPEIETKANHSSNGVGELTRSSESIVVVELGKHRQAPGVPMFDKEVNNICGGDCRAWPSPWYTAQK